ncbi:MAG: flagellar biosynthesis protein FlhA, partial [Henriciella sp.]|nr:flagellar biosynthesis protein FlhA [Henriciella sp.]
DIALPPDIFGDLTTSIQKKLNEYAQKGVTPSIATTSRRRRFIHTVLSSKGIRNSVLAYEEIGSRSKPYIVGVV